MGNNFYEVISRLEKAGISYNDAVSLRRISMTLDRWHELECGTGNGGIEQDEVTGLWYWYNANTGRKVYRVYDREKGALKRLALIMARYPSFKSYVQGDPRGAALFILSPVQVKRYSVTDANIDSLYNNGIAVYR